MGWQEHWASCTPSKLFCTTYLWAVTAIPRFINEVILSWITRMFSCSVSVQSICLTVCYAMVFFGRREWWCLPLFCSWFLLLFVFCHRFLLVTTAANTVTSELKRWREVKTSDLVCLRNILYMLRLLMTMSPGLHRGLRRLLTYSDRFWSIHLTEDCPILCPVRLDRLLFKPFSYFTVWYNHVVRV